LNQKLAALVLIVISLTGIGAFSFIALNANSQQIPPPFVPSTYDIEPVSSGALILSAEAIFWLDFMPSVPEEGPPFYVVIKINITNTGSSIIGNFSAPRTTLYYNGTLTAFATLELESAVQYFKAVEVGPGESFVMEFINERSTIFSPSVDEGTGLYARIFFVWENVNGVILTSPPAAVGYTY